MWPMSRRSLLARVLPSAEHPGYPWQFHWHAAAPLHSYTKMRRLVATRSIASLRTNPRRCAVVLFIFYLSLLSPEQVLFALSAIGILSLKRKSEPVAVAL